LRQSENKLFLLFVPFSLAMKITDKNSRSRLLPVQLIDLKNFSKASFLPLMPNHRHDEFRNALMDNLTVNKYF
jgi:hypothetical protein